MHMFSEKAPGKDELGTVGSQAQCRESCGSWVQAAFESRAQSLEEHPSHLPNMTLLGMALTPVSPFHHCDKTPEIISLQGGKIYAGSQYEKF